MITGPTDIIVCHTRNGKAAHALHVDCHTALGPWVNFESAATLERTLIYLGATADQIAEHRDKIRRWGQGSTTITLMPDRKNLLRIDYSKL